MITQETLNLFLTHREQLKDICLSRGLINIHIITPAMSEQKDTLFLLVERDKSKSVDMYTKTRCALLIKELIGCEIVVLEDGQIKDRLKADMLKNPIPIDNTFAIREIFNKQLIPFSENPELDISSIDLSVVNEPNIEVNNLKGKIIIELDKPDDLDARNTQALNRFILEMLNYKLPIHDNQNILQNHTNKLVLGKNSS